MRRKANGRRRRQVTTRKATTKARTRVVRHARKKGAVTNDEARRIGRWAQAYYHLNKLAEAGLLKRKEYNTWVPIKRRGRPAHV